jgi:cytochrome c oxidase accessory protein FixG
MNASVDQKKAARAPGGAPGRVDDDPVEAVRFFADRVRVYPKRVRGPIRRAKWAILFFCLTLYYLLPWVRWDRGPGAPSQAVLLDISGPRFYFFDLEIWPQEIVYLTGLLVLAAVALFLVTSIAGRLWCGFTCPQTVWTDLFMWVERVIEGDRGARLRRDAGPSTLDKVWRKIAKHTAWVVIAAATGGVWIMYYVDAPTLAVNFFTGRATATEYFFAGLFTATTYLLAGWAREQVCTYMCPWPRFQAAMFDDKTITVTYQAWRGETRGPHKAGQGWEGRGDCIDCGQCVAACPTGIDIRDGSQLECIGCGLCIDACNDVMRRVQRPEGLVTWDSLANQTAKAQGLTAKLKLIRPRSLLYLALLTVVSGAMVYGLATRSSFSISVQRDRAPLFVKLADGSVRNGYAVKVINKTAETHYFTLETRELDRAILQVGESGDAPATAVVLPVRADTVGDFRILVQANPNGVASRPITFILRNTTTGKGVDYRSVFLGPQS